MFSSLYKATPLAAKAARYGVQTRAYAIPVNSVSRSVFAKVSGEADAEKAEDITNRALQSLSKVPGFVGINRNVCKAEWDYHTHMIFKDIDSLKSYMESDTRNEILPLLDELKQISTTDVHVQNFVFDEKRA
eukprot:GFYU01009383.1.p2 GENE.GFYU01009383.1~~GFYU01009383.1.p2  ORF type:complete len:146 (-),score=44.23 GFYU01009383.1:59-454(-)